MEGLSAFESYIPSILLALGFISTSILGGLLVRSGMYKANQSVMEQTIASYEKQIVVRVELEDTLEAQNAVLRKQLSVLHDELEARDVALETERERGRIWAEKQRRWDEQQREWERDRLQLVARIEALEGVSGNGSEHD